MSGNVLVLAEHDGKQISDSTYELLGAARDLAAALGGQAEVALLGPRDLAAQLGGADVVVSVDHPALAEYLPEAYEQALLAVLAERSPRLRADVDGHAGPRPRRRRLGALAGAAGRLRHRAGGRGRHDRGHRPDPRRQGPGRA